VEQDYFYDNYYKKQGMTREKYNTLLAQPRQASYEIDLEFQKQRDQIKNLYSPDEIEAIDKKEDMNFLEAWKKAGRQNELKKDMFEIQEKFLKGERLNRQQLETVKEYFDIRPVSNIIY
jgi:hypothetical protein